MGILTKPDLVDIFRKMEVLVSVSTLLSTMLIRTEQVHMDNFLRRAQTVDNRAGTGFF